MGGDECRDTNNVQPSYCHPPSSVNTIEGCASMCLSNNNGTSGCIGIYTWTGACRLYFDTLASGEEIFTGENDCVESSGTEITQSSSAPENCGVYGNCCFKVDPSKF